VLKLGKMPTIEISRAPTAEDRQAVRDLFYRMALFERGRPLLAEMTWVLLGRQNPDQHVKILPDYCYNILDVFTRTYFKVFPSLAETVQVQDQAALASAETIEQVKSALSLVWVNLGQMFGIAGRCIRYADMEAKTDLERDMAGVTPEEEGELFRIIFGQRWLDENQEKIAGKSFAEYALELLNQHIEPHAGTAMALELKFHQWAYEWGEAATPDLHEGIPGGYKGFLDEAGGLAGESPRASIYICLLLAWPEIQAMLEAKPKKTVTDLHEWMLPFMRVGVCTYIDLDTLRRVCAPPRQSGIGLALRPTKTRRASA